jgi:hypothetical protein
MVEVCGKMVVTVASFRDTAEVIPALRIEPVSPNSLDEVHKDSGNHV